MNSKQPKTRPVPAPRLRFPGFVGEWEEKTGSQLFNQISNKKHNADLPILAITQDKGAVPRTEIDYHVSVTNESVDSYKIVEVNDFIISLRSFQGGIEYSRHKGICSPAYVILRATKEADIVYFQHYFKYAGFIKELTKNLEGLRDGKMISYKQFSEVPIPLPPSLPEQIRIAAALSSLDAVIVAHQSKQDALREHKRGLMAGLFPVEGERVPRLRFPEFEGAEEWEEKKISNCLSTVIDYRGKAPPKSNSGIPLITARNVRFGWLDMTEDEYIIQEKYESWMTKGIPRGGDILFTTEAPLGNVAFYPSTGRFALGQRIITLRPNPKVCQSEFLFHQLLHNDMQAKIEFNSTGSTAKGIKSSVFANIKIVVPSIPEQTRIAAALSSLDNLIAAQAEKITALQAFKRGLMQGLFPDARGSEER